MKVRSEPIPTKVICVYGLNCSVWLLEYFYEPSIGRYRNQESCIEDVLLCSKQRSCFLVWCLSYYWCQDKLPCLLLGYCHLPYCIKEILKKCWNKIEFHRKHRENAVFLRLYLFTHFLPFISEGVIKIFVQILIFEEIRYQ